MAGQRGQGKRVLWGGDITSPTSWPAPSWSEEGEGGEICHDHVECEHATSACSFETVSSLCPFMWTESQLLLSKMRSLRSRRKGKGGGFGWHAYRAAPALLAREITNDPRANPGCREVRQSIHRVRQTRSDLSRSGGVLLQHGESMVPLVNEGDVSPAHVLHSPYHTLPKGRRNL